MTKANRTTNLKFSAAPQRRNPWPAVLVGALALTLVGGTWWARSGGETGELGQTFPNQGQEHIAVGAQHPAYNSSPATSGWHYVQPQPWGTFVYEITPETLIHNLEHGGVVIQYNPALLKGDVARLEAIQKRFPNKTVVAPNSQLQVPLALTAWRRLYTLDTLDEAKIVDFTERYRNRAPERLPD
ncbi:DUF3105 domain-containing protein [Deinococcus humi]|uniref:DUF3105 domain-containing protein n=1 Tax=Deinococcus humi TaxID=662880 RepID=A0A7W8NFG4_9DEIO|nr:hypothetical protein [Deinococcus humi]GGO33213.1 hypothetical protein GCM10008949_32060 [Deinococcus humi]